MQDPVGLEWDDLLRAAARLQRIVPDAVLVGGTAAAEFARHRMSFDDDHVVADLRDRFDSVLGDLVHYRRLAPRWQSWPNVAIACRTLALAMIDRLPEAAP